MAIFFKSKAPDVPLDSDGVMQSVPFNTPRVITAAVSQLQVGKEEDIRKQEAIARRNTWQKSAWDYYDLIGELWIGANLIGATTSRIRLFIGYVEDETSDPRPIGEINVVPAELQDAARDTLNYLGNHTIGGISGLLKELTLNLFVAGDCYLVRDRTGFSETWSIQSIDSLRFDRSQDTVYIIEYPGQPHNEQHKLTMGEFFARIYRPHPRYSADADSSLRALLDLCDELLLLSKASRATIRSRLNSGVLFLPSELIAEHGEEDENSETIVDELTRAIITPIMHDDDPSAVMPTVVTGSSEAITSVRLLQFSRAFDDKHQAQLQNVLDRILAGLDLPKDIVAGIGDLKYANANSVEESLLQNHIQPMILAICDALTRAYLYPMLVAQGVITSDDPMLSKIVVWYDPSTIASRPDRESSSRTGLENNALSNEAWRKANGYTSNDAPTETEIAQKIAISRGAFSEPVTEALLRTLIPNVMANVAQQNLTQSGDTPQILNALNTVGEVQPEAGSPEAPTQLEEA